MSFVPLRKDLVVTKGKLQDLHLNIKSEDGQYVMSGNVGFKGLTGTLSEEIRCIPLLMVKVVLC